MAVKHFALIGSSGYIAPQHLKAIKDTGNILVAALDPFDSAGILDKYFPNCHFFTQFERFDRYLSKLKLEGKKIDYFSICSPNHLHDAHIRYGLKLGADVICEKPLVLNPWNVKSILQIEQETGNKVHNILQLRVHPSILGLKEQIESGPKDKIYEVDLTYITSRGNWYYSSWKGDQSKSGGIATNIGIHFFDVLTWIFGDLIDSEIHIHEYDRAAGLMKLKRANVRWFLSINHETLPDKIKQQGERVYRSIKLDGAEFEFSKGFTDLHTRCYESIIKDGDFRITDASAAIEIAHEIRSKEPVGLQGNYHPLANLETTRHPFKQ